jgi:hypothetical protein
MAVSLYQAAYGLTTIARLLQQSTRLRHNLDTYIGETDLPLSPFDEGNLWCALTGLTEHLTNTIEDFLARVGTDADHSPNSAGATPAD